MQSVYDSDEEDVTTESDTDNKYNLISVFTNTVLKLDRKKVIILFKKQFEDIE